MNSDETWNAYVALNSKNIVDDTFPQTLALHGCWQVVRAAYGLEGIGHYMGNPLPPWSPNIPHISRSGWLKRTRDEGHFAQRTVLATTHIANATPPCTLTTLSL